MIPIEFEQPTVGQSIQLRRAWLVVGASFAVFVALTALTTSLGLWVYHHATEPEIATLEVIGGRGALLRSPADNDWRLATNNTRVREGDRVSTALGTVVTLTMFDGTTVEVTENTDVRVVTMRSSRFLHRTKLVVLEPLRGTIYVSMVDRGRYRFSETIVRLGATHVSMADGEQQPEAGSFLVEVHERRGTQGVLRVAVLSGATRITTEHESLALYDAQQVEVEEDGTISPTSDAVRELLTNGDFQEGMSGWVEFQRGENDATTPRPPSASISIVTDRTRATAVTSVEFLRESDGTDAVDAGIRQRIGTTLRVHTSLVLDFEVRISNQSSLADGVRSAGYPLNIEINYIDVDGLDRRWQHGYYARADEHRNVPDEIATEIDPDTWQRIVFDLGNLDPRPKQVTSIVVYASGQRYATRVANLSLSSSEFDIPAGQ